MFDNLTNHQLLTDMWLDYKIFELKHRGYGYEWLWSRWVRG